jgi:hypothetical protein
VSYPDAKDVYRVLKPFEQSIMAVHLRAWDRLFNNPEFATMVYGQTGTGVMFDLLSQEVLAEFGENKDVTLVPYQGRSLRVIFNDPDGRVIARFKHGSNRGLGQNIDTAANWKFIDADAQLPGMPEDAMKVEILWYENLMRTKIDSVEITARDGKHKLWSYPIGKEPDVATLPFIEPVGPTAPAKPAGGLVTVKPMKKTTENKDDE